MDNFEQKSIANLQIIRSLVSEFGGPNKALGQNFLINQKSLFRFIDALVVSSEDIIVEIGPGLGVVSYTLCQKAKFVYLVEIDETKIPALKRVLEEFDNYEIILADATTYDFYTRFKDLKVKVIGSLPYNVCKPIIRNIFESEFKWNEMAFILQKEVAESYSSVVPKTEFIGAYADIFCESRQYKFSIKPDNFYPIPRVNSAVIYFKYRSGMDLKTKIDIARMVKSGFSSPRKKVSNNLKSIIEPSDINGVITNENARPSEVSYEEWVKIYSKIKK